MVQSAPLSSSVTECSDDSVVSSPAGEKLGFCNWTMIRIHTFYFSVCVGLKLETNVGWYRSLVRGGCSAVVLNWHLLGRGVGNENTLYIQLIFTMHSQTEAFILRHFMFADCWLWVHKGSSVNLFLFKKKKKIFMVCKSLLSTTVSEIIGPQQKTIEHRHTHSSVPVHT